MILSAALLSPSGVVFPGLRHADIVREVILTTQSVPDWGWQFGFITSAGDFVDRVVALSVAQHYGQVLAGAEPKQELRSEDIY